MEVHGQPGHGRILPDEGVAFDFDVPAEGFPGGCARVIVELRLQGKRALPHTSQ